MERPAILWRGVLLSQLSQPERLFPEDPGLVQFGTSFVKSEGFKVLFRDGMALVEDTAEYLDGAGRSESARLRKSGALAYASESMRLTTRLMQIASWLLVQRAVAEGEITSGQAQREKDRVRLAAQDITASARDFEDLPERFRELVFLSLRLHARVVHLDTLLVAGEASRPRTGSPVSVQQDLLRMAFGTRHAPEPAAALSPPRNRPFGRDWSRPLGSEF